MNGSMIAFALPITKANRLKYLHLMVRRAVEVHKCIVNANSPMIVGNEQT